MLNSFITEMARRLVRRDALTLPQWVQAIEERRALIEPHLREWNLDVVGKLVVASFNDRCRSWPIHQDAPKVVGDFDLETKCAFPRGEASYARRIESLIDFIYDPPGSSPAVGGRERFWALARSGHFVLIEVLYYYSGPRHDRGRAKAKEVSVYKCPLPELFARMQITPERVWKHLGKMVLQWKSDRERLLENSEHLSQIVSVEEQLYDFAMK